MIQLIMLKNNMEVARAELVLGENYTLGRSPASVIRLENEKRISRTHISLESSEDGSWSIQNHSRFGGLIYNGDEVEEINISEDDSFQLGPYTFQIIFDADQNSQKIDEPEVNSESVIYTQSIQEMDQNEEVITSTYTNDKNQLSNQPENYNQDDQNFAIETDKTLVSDFKINDDKTEVLAPMDDSKTMVEFDQLAAYLNILDTNNQVTEILKLDGNYWVAGRKDNCEIYLDNPNFSRKHFSIHLEKGTYYLTDLKSSNGTYINEVKTVPKESTPIKSGDVIRVKDNKFKFEVKLAGFENQLQQIDQKVLNLPVVTAQPHYAYPHQQMPHPQIGMQHVADGIVKLPPSEEMDLPLQQKAINWVKANKVRSAFIAIVLVLGWVLSSPDPATTKQSAQHMSKLSNDEIVSAKSLLKQSFNYYQQQKPALCLSTLDQLHKMTPSFENSKEIEKNCKQTLEILQEEREKQERQQVALETKEKIHGIVSDCRSKFTEQTTIDEAKACLTQALELDPSSSDIQTLLSEVEMNMEQNQMAQQQKEQRNRLIAAGKRAYSRAVSSEKKGHIRKAIINYEKFIKAGYPSLGTEKANAKRKLASLKGNFDKQVNKLLQACNQALSEKKYKEAYDHCDKLVILNPAQTQAKENKKQSLLMLTKQMKVIYTDSVFDESMGQVEAAKEKWREIIEKSVKPEEYYKKSKNMLKKYGEM